MNCDRSHPAVDTTLGAVVLVYEPDLLFSSRIESAGEKFGLKVNTISNMNELRERVKEGLPKLLLVNLDALEEQDESLAGLFSQGSCRSVGYYSHVQTESAEKALKRGFEIVIPRRAFAVKLSEIFAQISSG
jgi:hypothetical protein